MKVQASVKRICENC
ncbi:MAG: 50S ribosomal protein L36, partial [Thermoguttaceae bacterium]|nr:50S ribosomal protein L36 [Thermoguttaceae bacterium]